MRNPAYDGPDGIFADYEGEDKMAAAAVPYHLNINDIVTVTLTAHGNKIAESVCAPELRTADGLGQTRWSLWRLMQTFGPYFYVGCTQIFVDNRLIWA